MHLRKYVLAVAATLVAATAAAADIDGKWNSTVDSPQGQINLVWEFKAEGEKLTGTMSAEMMPAPAPISEGVIKGNEVSFKLAITMMPDAPPLVISYTGTLKGDELNMISKLDFGQGPMESPVLAKRAK